MKLSQPLLDSPLFQFGSFEEFDRAMAGSWGPDELAEAKRLIGLNLPPVTSLVALATMIGINPGLVWSMWNRPLRYYRSFSIPKGNGVREIDAPRVLLKVIQKWLSVQLGRVYRPPDHVYGFIPNRSHIDAAAVHCRARWIFSLDIVDFFPSTTKIQVVQAFRSLGYNERSADVLSSLCCLRGGLAQGSPASPVLSNICMAEVDQHLGDIARAHGVRLTRYADDIVFSGEIEPPADLENDIRSVLAKTNWSIAENKVNHAIAPARLKVHGLLVHGDTVRLTKGYRNKIRAYRHLLERNGIRQEDLAKIQGHLEYSKSVDRVAADLKIARSDPE